MDGLMFDTERIGLAAFCYAARAHGYNDTEKNFMKLIGMTVEDADQAIFQAFGTNFPLKAVRRERERYLSRIRKTSGIPMKAGLIELVKFLDEKGIPLGLASSSSRTIIEENLAHFQLSRYFQCILSGDEITHGKPHPEIYLKAARCLSKKPSTCLVLEDSVRGIVSAYAAGMIPVMVPDIEKPRESVKKMAHAVFSSLHEVQTYLSS